ncbi:MAG: glycosyltransferase family 2 protein [Rubrivivax sp.]|nr:glycosyltransferase family 2 protein [Rubrivivax sp.]
MTEPSPFFSVIIATRDRAELFEAAIRSVAGQSFTDMEIVVVNDGSLPEALPAYRQTLEVLRSELGTDRVQDHLLIRRPKGHGQSYSLNVGVERARGRYVCFLDDDDVWVDPEHLVRAAASILSRQDAAGEAVDLYTSNQEAFRGPERHPGPIWLQSLGSILQAKGRQPGQDGVYTVSVEELLQVDGFCHLNCLVVRRDLWARIGGMDEGIRWECDRDVVLRLMDVSSRILHRPAITSRHHIPDPKQGTSMTTSLGELERRMWQVRVLDKLAVFCRRPDVRAHARLHKGYAYKRIALVLAAQSDWRSALPYALQALACAPSFKWLAYVAYAAARAVPARR